MKKLFAFCLLLSAFCFLPCTLQAQTRVFHYKIKGNGKLITKTISISNFSKIDINTKVDVNFSQTPNTGSLDFTVDDNLLDYYDIYTKDSVLYIKIIDEYMENGIDLDLCPKKCLIKVSSEQLENIKMRGGTINFNTALTSKILNIGLTGRGKVLANRYPVQIEDNKITITGSGKVELTGTIQQADIRIAGSGSTQFSGTIRQVDIKISGSGKVELAGKMQQADIRISGSGSVKALECKTAQMQVNIAGSGSVEAHVTDSLDASISGCGSMRFKGDPYPFIKNIAGSGKIKKL